MSNPVRLDVWLWAARLFKTRSLAKQAIEAGQVEINQQPGKPARPVRVADVIVVRRAEERIELAVLALAEQRGPANVASTLYAETAASQAARARAREQRKLLGYRPPPGRPDRRARQALRKLEAQDD